MSNPKTDKIPWQRKGWCVLTGERIIAKGIQTEAQAKKIAAAFPGSAYLDLTIPAA